MEQAKPGRLSWVQVGRALAALVVVASHIRPVAGSQFDAAAKLGPMGVEFFFLLSGFIMFYAHRRDIGQPAALASYCWKRVIRIYPTYWIALICVMIVTFALVSPEYHPIVDWRFAVREGLILPGGHLFIGPAWTLRHELLFYAVFATFILSKRIGILLFGAWMMAVLAVSITGTADFRQTETLGEIVFHHYNLDFALGMAAAACADRKQLRILLTGAAIVAALFLTAYFNRSGVVSEWYQIIGYKAAFLAVLLGAVELSMRGIPAPRALVFLGAASYAIYLLNRDVGYTMERIFRRFAPVMADSWSGFAIAFVVAVAAGVFLYVFLETPIMRFLRRALPKGRQTNSAVIQA